MMNALATVSALLSLLVLGSALASDVVVKVQKKGEGPDVTGNSMYSSHVTLYIVS